MVAKAPNGRTKRDMVGQHGRAHVLFGTHIEAQLSSFLALSVSSGGSILDTNITDTFGRRVLHDFAGDVAAYFRLFWA